MRLHLDLKRGIRPSSRHQILDQMLRLKQISSSSSTILATDIPKTSKQRYRKITRVLKITKVASPLPEEGKGIKMLIKRLRTYIRITSRPMLQNIRISRKKRPKLANFSKNLKGNSG
jgi:hypothetical protein